MVIRGNRMCGENSIKIYQYQEYIYRTKQNVLYPTLYGEDKINLSKERINMSAVNFELNKEVLERALRYKNRGFKVLVSDEGLLATKEGEDTKLLCVGEKLMKAVPVEEVPAQ